MTPEGKKLWNESFLLSQAFIYTDRYARYANEPYIPVYKEGESQVFRIVYKFFRHKGQDYLLREVHKECYYEYDTVAKVHLKDRDKIVEIDLSKVVVVKVPGFRKSWLFSYLGKTGCPVKELMEKDQNLITDRKLKHRGYYERVKEEKHGCPPGFENQVDTDIYLGSYVKRQEVSLQTFIDIGYYIYKIAKHKFFKKK